MLDQPSGSTPLKTTLCFNRALFLPALGKGAGALSLGLFFCCLSFLLSLNLPHAGAPGFGRLRQFSPFPQFLCAALRNQAFYRP